MWEQPGGSNAPPLPGPDAQTGPASDGPSESEGKVRVTQWVKLDPSRSWLQPPPPQGLFQLRLTLAERGITTGFRVPGHGATPHMVQGLTRLRDDGQAAAETRQLTSEPRPVHVTQDLRRDLHHETRESLRKSEEV